MANFFEHKERRVVPNWRSFGKTTVLGELDSIQQNRKVFKPTTNIDEYKIDWSLNKNVIHAAELLSAAVVNNRRQDEAVFEAARYILNNINSATISQVLLAEQILNKTEEIDLSNIYSEVSLDKLASIVNPEPIRKRLKANKDSLKSFPFNSVLHVENSRYYSILGQEQKSIDSMKIALHIAPNNRFVLRCATRLFIHYAKENNDYLDYIHNILRRNPLTSFDPWLTSAEISISTIRSRTSQFLKKGVELINSKNISPFNFTELASSIGTVELLNGSNKKSRDFFNKALINPNDNSLAQIEWASTKDSQIVLRQSDFEVRMNFEALSLDHFHNNEFESALDNAARWFIDMPFSKRPVMFGSNLASTILKDQKKAIDFLNAGLISHPNDPMLINNLAYSLSLDGRASEALVELNKIKSESITDETTHICLNATRGLALLRSGIIEPGRDLYLKAIEASKAIKRQDLNWIAILNYAREEILLDSEYVNPIMDAVHKIPSNSKDAEIRILKNEVIDLHQKSRE